VNLPWLQRPGPGRRLAERNLTPMAERNEPRRDPDAVYRVVRIVATHPGSWEEAAAAGIAELAKTIVDLRVARVTELDAVVRDGAPAAFRVKLEASYRIDRRRVEDGAVITVRRVLVVANESLGKSGLVAAIAQRIAAGPIEVHVLAPLGTAGWGAVAALGDPGSGYVPAGASVFDNHEEAVAAAEARVRAELTRLRQLGASGTGEVAFDDPLDAVSRVLDRSSFDEILVSTLPSAMSRWLRLDLTRRLQRRVTVPVTEINND